MSDWGFKTYYADGSESFNIFMPVIRQETLVYIPANSSGSIDLTGYLAGSAAVRFVPAGYHTFIAYLTAPYAYMSGSSLIWVSAGYAHYAIVTGVVR